MNIRDSEVNPIQPERKAAGQGRHDLRKERAIHLVTDGAVYSIAPQAMTLGGDNDTPARAARRKVRHGHFRLEAMPVMPCVITRHCEKSRGVDAARYSESPQESRWDKSTLFRTSGAEINTTRMKRNNNRQKFYGGGTIAHRRQIRLCVPFCRHHIEEI